MREIPPPADQAVDPKALVAYLQTLDFQSGQPVTNASHHQGEVRRFEPSQPNLPAQLIIKRPISKKTAQTLGWGLRETIKRWASLHALKREYQAYERLATVSGIPICYGFYSGQYLVLEWIDGEPLSELGTADQSMFGQLRQTIDQMHAAGVAHGDLKRKENILVSADGIPVIIDFGTALIRKEGFHPINHWLFALLAQTDRNAWIKHKYSGYEGIDVNDVSYLKRSWPERALSYWRSRNRDKP